MNKNELNIERLDWLEQVSKTYTLIPLKGYSKLPLEKSWQKTERKFDKNRFANCNAGIVTGKNNNLIVLDIDNWPIFESILRMNQIPTIPRTFTVKTGGCTESLGKYHFYFKYPNDKREYGNKSIKTLGIDFRGNGGFVVAPYSTHPDTQRQYEIVCNEAIAEMPEWLKKFYPEKKEWKMINIESMSEDIRPLIEEGKPKGERSEAVMTVLNYLVSRKMSKEQIFYIFYTYPIGDKFMEKGQDRDEYLLGEIQSAEKYVNENNIKISAAEENQIPLIEIIRGNEILQKEYEINPLIDGLLDENGSLLIVGQTGIGKSILTLNLAMIMGTPSKINLWNKFSISRPLKSVFIQSENSEQGVWQRIKTISANDEMMKTGAQNLIFPRINDSFVSMGFSFKDKKFSNIVEHIKNETDFDVLIIDPLISFSGVEENNNSEMRKSLDVLSEITQRHKLAVILIHHTGKTGNQGVFAGRGASAIADWASNIIVLSKEPIDDRQFIRITNEKARNFRPFEEFYVTANNESFIMKEIDPYDKFNFKQILDIIDQNSGKFDTQKEFIDELINKLKISYKKATEYIKKSVDKGYVRETRYG